MGSSPGERLASFRRGLGMTQAQLATSIGVSPASVAFVERDERPPSRSFLQKISSAHSVSSDWLLNGHGGMLLPPSRSLAARHGSVEQVDPTRPDHGDIRFDGVEYAFARRMALSISAGNGLEAVDDGDAEGLAFPVSWLRRQGINADLAVLVSVKGDSMAPAIPDGALVLIHVAERSIASPGIYAFNLDGASFVKRLVPQSSEADGRPGAVAIMSDNHSYPPIVLSGKDLNRITVVGRVRAVVAQV